MKVFHVSWNAPETVFHEMLWKKRFTVYPCLKAGSGSGCKKKLNIMLLWINNLTKNMGALKGAEAT